MDREKRYRETLDWIHNLGRFGIRPGLERVTALLAHLGKPHHQLRFVHVGGTNGKGSTAAMLAAVLRAAGYRVGLYTSPYLLSFTNRMAVNGNDIDPGQLIELVDQVRPVIEKISEDPALGPLSEFEVVTVLALAYFARQRADLVVLEVGLGGRLDATNVVTPLMSIITNVSLEHTDVLGDTVEAIAAEKAGIIKKGRPVLTASDDRRVLDVLQKRCANLDAPLHRVYTAEEGKAEMDNSPSATLEKIVHDGQYFSYSGFSLRVKELFIPLRGAYQLTNAATALASLELLEKDGFVVSENLLRKGLSETSWPGRLELLREKPLLVMDGAHNPAAMERLSEAMPRYFKYSRLILVIGILADKDIPKMLQHILPLADAVIFTRPLLPRAAEPDHVAEFARNYIGLPEETRIISDFGEALKQAIGMAGPEDAVLVTGSLYIVSDARAHWKQHLC